MRKLSLTALFIILTASMLFGEGLGTNAQNIKKLSPDGYEIIKARAIDKWGDDHNFVLYEINEQIDSLVEVIELLADNGDPMIFINVVIMWSVNGTGARNANIIDRWVETGDFSNVFLLAVDWYEVLYEYEIWSQK